MPASPIRAKNWWSYSIFAVLSLGALYFALWRTAFGFDGMDEAFFLVHGFKLLPAGDTLFNNEILSGPRQQDLFNYLFVQPLIPFSVLNLRIAAVITYALLLFAYLMVCFRGKPGLFAGLSFFICLVFDYFLMPTWSYNWWVRDLFLAHHAVILLIPMIKRTWAKRALSLIAGVLLGGVVLVYNPMAIVAVLIALFAIGWSLTRSEKRGEFWLTYVVPYFLGFGAVIGADIIYIVTHGLGNAWWNALQTVTKERYNASNLSPLHRFLRWVTAFFFVKELLFLAVLWVLYESRNRFQEGKGRIAWWSVVALCAAYLVRKVGLLEDSTLLLRNLFLPIATFGGLLIIGRAIKARSYSYALAAFCGILGMMVMTNVSVTQEICSYFLAPLLVVPFASVLENRFMQPPFMATLRSQSVRALWVGLFGFFAFASWRFIMTGCYRDFPPANVQQTFNVAPLKGIWTNARRAFLYEKVSDLVKDKKYVLAYDLVPFVFLFGEVKSAVNSAQVDSIKRGPERSLAALRFMIINERTPDLILRARKHPWSWGGDPDYFKYDEKHVFDRFTECAKAKTIADYDEFQAFQVDKSKVSFCVASVHQEFQPLVSFNQ